MARTCRRCGATADAPEGGVPGSWSLDTSDGELAFLCAACTRGNLRDIEARLSPEWWSDS
jgi:hypothetical protein